MTDLLPLQPLLDAVDDPDPLALHRRTGLARSGIYKAIQRGYLTIWAADRAAIALGSHPLLIWGDQWLDERWYRAGRIDVAFDTLREVAS